MKFTIFLASGYCNFFANCCARKTLVMDSFYCEKDKNVTMQRTPQQLRKTIDPRANL